MNRWDIRAKYIEMVHRYESEKNIVVKLQMKYKFIDWMRCNYTQLTEAEVEYLEKSITYVDEIHW